MSIDKINSPYVEFVLRKNAIRFMLLNFPPSWILKRVLVEVRIFLDSYLTINKGNGLESIKLRTGREKKAMPKTNVYAILYNMMNLCEIVTKRRNRTAKLLATE